MGSEKHVLPRDILEYYCPGTRCRELSLARGINHQGPLARSSEVARLNALREARGPQHVPVPPFEVTAEFESRSRAAQHLLVGNIKELCTNLQHGLAEHSWWRSIERDSHSDGDRKLYERLVHTFLIGARKTFEAVFSSLMERAKETSPADGAVAVNWTEEVIRSYLNQYCDPAELAQLMERAGLVVLDQVPEWLENDCNVRAMATNLGGRIEGELHRVAADTLMRTQLREPTHTNVKPPSVQPHGSGEPKHKPTKYRELVVPLLQRAKAAREKDGRRTMSRDEMAQIADAIDTAGEFSPKDSLEGKARVELGVYNQQHSLNPIKTTKGLIASPCFRKAVLRRWSRLLTA